MLSKLLRSDSWLCCAESAYCRSFSDRLPKVVLVSGSAAAMIARWTEAYSLAEEKADSARVRWIISGLLVASAMSCESSRSWVMTRWYDSTVCVALLGSS